MVIFHSYVSLPEGSLTKDSTSRYIMTCIYIYVHIWWILDNYICVCIYAYVYVILYQFIYLQLHWPEEKSTSYDLLGDHQVITWLKRSKP